MSKTEDLNRRRARVMCPGAGQLSPIAVASARGATLVDLEGREYIDFAGGIGVMNVGHCNEEVVRAVRAQAGMLLHTSIHVATYEPYIELCEKLVELFPHGDTTKALLLNSGSEAVENAIKIARQATRRPGVICFTNGFHGRTLLCASLTSKTALKSGCGPFAPEIYRLPFPVVRARYGPSEAEVVARELARLNAAFRDTVAAEYVAAVIIEVVQGEGGFNVAPRDYIRGLREICTQHGIMLIFDEVQTGFCRTGRWAAYEHYDVRPDISPWAKSLGGGLPISAVLARGDVMDRVAPTTVGGTYGGNPVACAAALAAIRAMESLNLNAAAERTGEIIRARLERLHERCEVVTDVRGLGAMLAIEFCEAGDPRRPAPALVKRIITQCRERGLLIIPAGIDGNNIRVLAPLTISDAELETGLAILEATVLAEAATNG